MSTPAAAPRPQVPEGPMTKERLGALLATLLGGPDAGEACKRILSWADQYAANQIELYARPDDRWGPR